MGRSRDQEDSTAGQGQESTPTTGQESTGQESTGQESTPTTGQELTGQDTGEEARKRPAPPQVPQT